jgi:effector-binding domain-containing protein
MKALKVIGIILLILVAAVVVLGLVAPKDYRVERSIQINAPKELVFNHVKYWKNWQEWSPWAEMDSSMKVSVVGLDGQPGSVYKWAGPKVGEGEMSNTGIKANEQIEYHLRFLKPWESESEGYLKVADAGQGSTASWGFYGENPFPWNALMVFMSMDKMVGKDFDRGLALLKDLSEKDFAKVLEYEIKEVDFPAQTYAAVQKEISFNQMTNFFMENMPKVWTAVTNTGGKPLGAPCGIYYSWDEQNMKTDVAAAIPVKKPVADLKAIKLPAAKAYVIDYYGPYEASMYAHYAFDYYFREHGLKMAMPVVEQYVTDPGSEPDSAKWLTRIYYFAL